MSAAMETEHSIGRGGPMIHRHLEIGNVRGSQETGDVEVAGKLRRDEVVEASVEASGVVVKPRGGDLAQREEGSGKRAQIDDHVLEWTVLDTSAS